MSNLLLALVKAIVSGMVAALSPAQVKTILDSAFDAIEAKVNESPTHWDNDVVLPMVKALRASLNVPADTPEETQQL